MIDILTYDEILDTMKNKFKEETGCEAYDASDIGIKLRVLAGQLYSHSQQMNYVCKQLFLKTATGKYLDEHAKTRGFERKKATKAHGVARFFCEEEAQADIIISKGTRCAILGEESQIYETTQDAILPQGQQYVDVDIIAVESGSKCNGSKGVITTLINPPQFITSVTNVTELTGGSEQECDEKLRQRLFDSFRAVSNGANPQYYIELVMQNPKVISANIINCARGAGTVDVVFETNEQEEVQINTLKSQLDKVLAENREIGTDAKAFNCINEPLDINVFLKIENGYDQNYVVKNCKEKIQKYVTNLLVGENLKLSEVSNILYNIDGVSNYKIVSPLEDTSISGRSKLSINTLNVVDAI